MALSDAEQKLLGELEETYPESWNFKDAGVGGTIVGRVIAQRVATFDRDGEQQQQKICVVQSSDGEKRTVWMTSVLLSVFGRERIAIGDMVAIKYEGLKSPEAGGNDYHNFTVRVQKPEGAALDWGAPTGAGRRATDNQFVPAGGSEADFQGTDDDIPF